MLKFIISLFLCIAQNSVEMYNFFLENYKYWRIGLVYILSKVF